MTLTLPDDPALLEVGNEEILLGLACGLYAAGQVSRNVAARIAGLDRAAFDALLFEREIPAYTEDMLEHDLRMAE